MKGLTRAIVAAMCVVTATVVGTGRAAADHSVTSLTPSTMAQGTQQQVVINGSGFSNSLGSVSVEVSGGGVNVSQVTLVSSTRITATFSLTNFAAVGSRNVTVSQGLLGSDTVECQHCLAITARPIVTSFTPASGPNTSATPPATTNLSVSGSGFVEGSVLRLRKNGYDDVVATAVAVGGGGTTLAGTVDLTGQAAGRWMVVVDNPDGGHGENGNGTTTGFLITGLEPTITSTSPGEGAAGASGVEIVLAGTNFARGATVSLSGTGITLTNPTWMSLTSFKVTADIASSAPGGPRDVTLTNLDGLSATLVGGFAVTTRVSSITPNSAANTGTATITEIAGGGFADDVSVQLERPGFAPVPLTNVAVAGNGTKISGRFDLSPTGAPPVGPGPWNVRVHNPGTQAAATLPNGFTVTGNAPVVTGVDPQSIGQGGSQAAQLSGSNFADGSVAAVSGTGVTVGSTTVVSGTRIDLVVTVSPDAAPGARSVTVTNADGQTGTLPSGLTVVSAPVTSSISPSSLNQGTTSTVTFTGERYLATPAVSVSGSGVSLSNLVRQSATQLTATVAVAANAAPGARNVTVTNPDGGTSTCNSCFAVVAAGTIRLDGWQGLGDPLGSGAGVASVIADTSGVFFRAPDGSVRVRVFQNNAWSPAASLGGITPSGPAAAGSGGVIDVVVRGGDDGLWINSCAGGACGGWGSIGGRTRQEPAVVSWGPGRLDVFVMGLDSQLWHRPRVNGSWGAWTPLGGILSAGPSATSAAVGNIEVAVRGSDGAVWVKSFNGSWGGYVAVGGFIVDEPAIVARPGGFVDLFVRALDDRVWYGRRTAGTWVGFQPLGGIITAAPAAGLMTGASPNPVTQIAVRGSDGRLWVNRARFSS